MEWKEEEEEREKTEEEREEAIWEIVRQELSQHDGVKSIEPAWYLDATCESFGSAMTRARRSRS